jgi:hypothetical protein
VEQWLVALRSRDSHLNYLKAALPAAHEPWVLVDKKSIRWNPSAPSSLDSEEFERLSARTEGRAKAGANSRARFLRARQATA